MWPRRCGPSPTAWSSSSSTTATPRAPTSTPPGGPAPTLSNPRPVAGDRALLGQGAHHVVDTGAQRGHVLRIDGREHGDAELIAAELAIGLGVHDPVGPQDGGDGRCVHGVDE